MRAMRYSNTSIVGLLEKVKRGSSNRGDINRAMGEHAARAYLTKRGKRHLIPERVSTWNYLTITK
jgi:putative heme iron utilization protein